MSRQGVPKTPTGSLPAQPDWHDRAACHGQDRLFFMDPGERYRAARAKAICDTCPVKQPCLDYAISLSQEDDDYGIWGGTSPTERKQIRRQRRGRTAA